MSAYAGTWSLVSDQAIPPPLVALARKLVGKMLDNGQPQGFWRLDDGSMIRAMIVDGIPKVTFTQPPRTEERLRLGDTNLWVPRGFVVYPAWHDAPFGVGLPMAAGAGLAPGLAKAKWTPGGPCGEVLLSADKDAGYPDARKIPVPLLYHPTKGPVFRWTGNKVFDARPLTGPWTAYRLEIAPFDGSDPAQNASEQQVLLDMANAARVAAGQAPATQRLRGFSRPAEIMANIMAVAKTTVETTAVYPPTYQNMPDRLTKDGYPGDWRYAAFSAFDRAHLYGTYEFRAANGAAGAVAGWRADSNADLTLLADYGPAPTIDAGAVGDYRAMVLSARDHWIGAGNMSWQSSDTALPPLSWYGFASLSLLFETYPAEYTGDLEVPMSPQWAFLTPTGDVWLNYPRKGSAPGTAPRSSEMDPAMGRHVYSRGRAIAMAPNGALVWGACVQRVNGVDRLILLAHHGEDQPADYTRNGWTRYLRVWWCDVPARALRLDPQQVICGTDPDDPLSWRGGELIDVGLLPSMNSHERPGEVNGLKMSSQWRFSPDGTRAVCLRTYGVLRTYASYDSLVGVYPLAPPTPRPIELVFTAAGDTLNTTLVAHPLPGGAAVTPSRTVQYSGWTAWEYSTRAAAVDYAADGTLVYAYTTRTDYLSGGEAYVVTAGVGGAGAVWASDLTHSVVITGNMDHAGQSFDGVLPIIVADVRSGAFVVEGMHSKDTYGDVPPPGGGRPRVDNPSYVPCWTYSDAPVFGVRMFARGKMLDESWYPNPDGIIVSLNNLCLRDGIDDGVAGTGVYLVDFPFSHHVQVHWAERFGQYVFSTQCSPVPQAARVRDYDAPDGDCGCNLAVNDIVLRSHRMTFDEVNPRGGHAVASVPLPDNDWLIYAKVV